MTTNRVAGRPARLWLPVALLSCLLSVGSGCDRETWNQYFNKTLLDPTQPIRLDTTNAIIGMNESLSLYDEPLESVPENATDPRAEDLDVVREDYRIAPGDELLIQIYDLIHVDASEQLSRRVTETGFIRLPQLPDDLFVASLTEKLIEQQIAQAYKDSGLLANPRLSVRAQTRENRTFQAIGAFNQPGQYFIRSDNFRLLDALGLVGGVTNATIAEVYVIRVDKYDEVKPPAGSAPAPSGDGAGPTPLPLPGGNDGGGSAPMDLPGGASMSPPAPAPAVPAAAPATGNGESDIRRTMLQDGNTASPPANTQPQDTVPDHNGIPPAPMTEPYGRGEGKWLIIGGKWTFVAQPAASPTGQPAAGQEGASTPKRTRVIRIDLRALRNGDDRYNLVMRHGDTVVTPQPIIGEFYLTGNVNRPGVYSLTDRKITLTQGIAAGGGLGQLAIPSRVQLIRRLRNNQQQTFLIDFNKIVLHQADDIVLKPNDVVNVGSSVYAPFLAVLRNAFRATYGVGFVYDRNLADIEHINANKFP
ncbi:MAG: hypothetical protein BIFFINMI_01300 [Phycisphaerae bacterium]|nr:hypothetical protein [Phycisphaerae bacterium]